MTGYVYSLEDCFRRCIPVTSIEFNPPPVSTPVKQQADYWLNLENPDEEDRKILKTMKAKIKAMIRCRHSGSFMSVTDSAAGIPRINNLEMLRLFEDPGFCRRHLDQAPAGWEHKRVILHLTRNHSVAWTRAFLKRVRSLGFDQLLLITGDPLKDVRLKTVTAEDALTLDETAAREVRLKNSIELLRFVQAVEPDLYPGAAHNPFMKREVAHKHLLNKVDAGARFLITQPVSYYDECWRVMAEFEEFRKQRQIDIPIILGVFNYAVPCTSHGYKPEVFEKRHKFWKKLFGFVPTGVRTDYDLGLNGIEILARSINKLKRMGYFHFDVMNAERNGYSVVLKGRNFTRELDRLVGVFQHDKPGI
ncbi:MAG: methylenetetrahydrofolate reductase [Acidobacteriota bacterium]|nr:methylenetetrahydrofolate reductase [Acidobacteriota bacterium]